MPIPWLVDYWGKAVPAAWPFLRNRKIAVQQVFDKNILYRRHGAKGLPDKSGWITLNSPKDIIAWAKLHTYSFHPHLLGEKDVWFVMDLDARTDKMFDLVKLAAYEMAKLLDKKGIEYLLKFSGNRGFHFMWSLGDVKPDWLKFRKQIRQFAAELETILQTKHAGEFYKIILKKNPIITTSSTDKTTAKSILLDEQIIHKNGMIRSPYSVHPATGLVSIPLTINQLLKFNPTSALPTKIKIREVVLPINKL
ncbi:MAG: DNA primase small subunit domain-containing protein [Patescibacteria group bacterium]|jgi:DNA primase